MRAGVPLVCDSTQNSRAPPPVLHRYYAKAVNCCADVRSVLNMEAGDCPPVGTCRGFDGTCGELPTQFAETPVLPDYPNGLQDYTCTAFPDDANSVDTFIVGLIALAVAIPVTVFISTCFESAWHAAARVRTRRAC